MAGFDISRQHSWTPSAQHVSDARRFVTECLRVWRARDVTDAVALVTSELVTNAVVHARTPFTVTVAWNGRVALVRVLDGSADLPQPGSGDGSGNGVGGRGLLVVDHMSVRWGWNTVPDGKNVWAVVGVDAWNSPSGVLAAGLPGPEVSVPADRAIAGRAGRPCRSTGGRATLGS